MPAEPEPVIHRQVGHQRVACGAADAFPFDVTIRADRVTCPACRAAE